MCVSCLVVSALTFFIPVSDVPVPNAAQSASTSVSTTLVRPQLSSSIAKVQKEIQAILVQLPNSSGAEILRHSLRATSTRLNTATSDQQAQNILDEENDKLAEAVKKAPNASQIAEILLDVRDRADAQNLKNGTRALKLQSNAGFMFLQKGLQLNQRSGWLS
jgi:hypothetical protein